MVTLTFKRLPNCFLVSLLAVSFLGTAQCPVNIGFEAGSFYNWQCSMGTISDKGVISLNSSNPVPDIHTLYQNSYPQETDFYGGFPVNCPNGSDFSIRLGNKGTGRGAERVSYTFTIPPNENNYSIIYHYAVVFQNPNHAVWEQPKFTANVYDESSNDYIGCSSFEFAASANLPGFQESSVLPSVFFKPWTPITIKLSGYAGRTIRLEFTTNDCTRGGHFGYAYIDVNENCTAPVTGNTFCPGNDSLNLVAPFGFMEYNWYNADFSQKLGTQNILKLKPIPPPNTVFALEVIPFPKQGCLDTIYTPIKFSNELIKLVVKENVVSCISNPIDLTAALITSGSSSGLRFEYYSDASQNNYLPTPKVVTKTGTYYIKGINLVGCEAVGEINVKVGTYPAFAVSTDPFATTATRPLGIDLNSLIYSTENLTYSFWKDSLSTIPLGNFNAINKTGTYFIRGDNPEGCATVHSATVSINEPKFNAPNAFSPNGDGINDVWNIPLLLLYPECVVDIYNRFGQHMFHSSGYQKSWNGKLNGSDLPVGTYYYVIKPSPELPVSSGSITIIR